MLFILHGYFFCYLQGRQEEGQIREESPRQSRESILGCTQTGGKANINQNSKNVDI